MTLYRWQRSKDKKQILELTDPSGSVLATVQLQSWWSTTAELTLRDGKKFLLQRPSMWRGTIEIVDAESKAVLGKFSARWTGDGTLQWNGREYRWKCRSWWKGTYAWMDASDQELQTFTPRWTWTQMNTEVEAHRPSADADILLAAGWYLLHLQTMDGSAAAM